eukprot:TRINITY_DN31904_c0_g2_i1.p1 TRINITY_DN31904_c0_g2~~TRINITY_DN31904_c0_g2_i1.p1  ORF type:complete len:455 (+),score=70.75 TRINITY_DN31904_c0_g2_i1:57-1421(+)
MRPIAARIWWSAACLICMSEAWGPKGHDRIARVAERLLHQHGKEKRKIHEMLFGFPMAGHLVSLTTWEENMTKNYPETNALHWHKQIPELECIDFNNRRHIRCEDEEGADSSLFCALVFLFNHFAHGALLQAYPEMQEPVHIPRELRALAAVPKNQRHKKHLLRWLIALLGDLHQPLHWFQEHNYARDMEVATKVNYTYESLQDDCAGNDLNQYRDTNTAACEAICNNDNNCAGFTFSTQDPARFGSAGCLTKSKACSVQAGTCNNKFCFWKKSKTTETANLLDIWESQIPSKFPDLPNESVIQQQYHTNQLVWKHKRPTELFRDWAKEVASVVCDEIYGPMREAGGGIIHNPHAMTQDLYDRWALVAANLTEIAGQRIAFILLDLAEHREHQLAHALWRGRRHHTRHWASDLQKNLLICVLTLPLLLGCLRFFQEKSLGNKVWPFDMTEEKVM